MGDRKLCNKDGIPSPFSVNIVSINCSSVLSVCGENCELTGRLCSERLLFRVVLCLQYLHKLVIGTSGKHQNSGKRKTAGRF